MRIKELWCYPVKSLAGSQMQEAALAPRGFVDDRRWMLVDDNGRFISQREYAHLARWQATVADDALMLTHLDTAQTLTIEGAKAVQGMPLEVMVWDDRITARSVATDAQKLSAALGVNCRLVYMAADSHRPLDPKHARADEEVSFADGYPYLLANTASVAALSQAMGESLSMQRFRPNIVFEGAPAFAEDEWRSVQIGTSSFRLVKPCARCVVITIDPETLEKNMRVFATLKDLHSQGKKVLFGINTCWEGRGEATIAVGDPITITA